MTSELLEKAKEKAKEIDKMRKDELILSQIKDAVQKEGGRLDLSCRAYCVTIPEGKVADIILAILESDFNDRLKHLRDEFTNLN